MRNIFFNSQNGVKNVWWVAIFYFFLALFLFPLIIISNYYHFEILIIYQVILILVASFICQRLRKKPFAELTGKIDRSWFGQFLLGLLGGGILMIVPAILLTILGYVKWQVNDFGASSLISGIAIILIASLAEELLFRGFIFQRLIDAFGQWPAQFIIAGMFLLTHLDNHGMTGETKIIASVNIFIASILFGAAFIKTGKLAMAIGLHFMANVMQGSVLGFGVSGEKEISILTPVINDAPTWLSGGAFGLEASVPGLLVLVIMTILLLRWKTDTYQIFY